MLLNGKKDINIEIFGVVNGECGNIEKWILYSFKLLIKVIL